MAEQNGDLRQSCDPARWYAELLANGGKEIQIKKTSLVRLSFASGGEMVTVGQEGTRSKLLAKGDVLVQNVNRNGKAHKGESPYPYGDHTKSSAERLVAFHQQYIETAPGSGLYRERDNTPRTGIKVNETRVLRVDWSPEGAKLEKGGYLIKRADGTFSPLNKSSLWGYEIPFEGGRIQRIKGWVVNRIPRK